MLNEEQIQKVRLTMYSDGWKDVIQPAIVNRGNLALKALALTRTERAKEFKSSDFDTDDDVLRAVIRDCEWMVAVWHNEVQRFDYNRQRDELARNTANP